MNPQHFSWTSILIAHIGAYMGTLISILFLASHTNWNDRQATRRGTWAWFGVFLMFLLLTHMDAVPDTVREMEDADPIQDIPVSLLTPGISSPLGKQHLLRIGDNVRQAIAHTSGHWIHLDEPDLVMDSIRKVVMAEICVPVREPQVEERMRADLDGRLCYQFKPTKLFDPSHLS